MLSQSLRHGSGPVGGRVSPSVSPSQAMDGIEMDARARAHAHARPGDVARIRARRSRWAGTVQVGDGFAVSVAAEAGREGRRSA